MASGSSFILDLGMVTAVAALTGVLASAIKQPAILGYLLAGLLLGPYVAIPLSADMAHVDDLAQFGLVFVMFAVGLEFRVSQLLKILPTSGFTALVQVATLMWAGTAVASVFGWSTAGGVCLGAAMAISSTMVVSAVLSSTKVAPEVNDHVMGVLVVQDVVSIVLMTVVTALVAGTEVEASVLVGLVAQLLAVVIGLVVLGVGLARVLIPLVQRFAGSDGLAVVAVGFAFGFASIAAWFGYSVALGAFVAGMAVAESGRGHAVSQSIDSLRAVFAAIFFVSIGMTVDPWLVLSHAGLVVVIAGLVFVGQFLSVALSSVLSGISLRSAVFSGLLLGQVGEMGFILVGIGQQGGLVPPEAMPAIVGAAILTTFTTPWMLARADKIARAVDTKIPRRMHNLLTVHQAFMVRLRGGEFGFPLPPAFIALVLDWLALVLLAVGRGVLVRKLAPWVDSVWVNLAVIVVAVPFVLGLVYSAFRAVTQIRTIIDSGVSHQETAKILEGVAYFTLLLGLGQPTVALVGSLIGRSTAALVVFLSLAALAWMVRRRLDDFDGAYTSSVARLAHRLSNPEVVAEAMTAHVSAAVVVEPSVGFRIAGVENLAITLPAGVPAIDQTLAELNLRCLSGGATVVEIRRGDQEIVLPSAQERLRLRDVLVVSGAHDAVERAKGLLLGTGGPDPASPCT